MYIKELNGDGTVKWYGWHKGDTIRTVLSARSGTILYIHKDNLHVQLFNDLRSIYVTQTGALPAGKTLLEVPQAIKEYQQKQLKKLLQGK